jgi:hypothetical protein
LLIVFQLLLQKNAIKKPRGNQPTKMWPKKTQPLLDFFGKKVLVFLNSLPRNAKKNAGGHRARKCYEGRLSSILLPPDVPRGDVFPSVFLWFFSVSLFLCGKTHKSCVQVPLREKFKRSRDFFSRNSQFFSRNSQFFFKKLPVCFKKLPTAEKLPLKKNHSHLFPGEK